MSKTVLVIHGPNLNMLGKREPDLYGKYTLVDINSKLEKIGKKNKLKVKTFFSNIEGEIVECIQKNLKSIDALIINAAGYTHTSVAIRDALLLLKVPIIEVHITNIFKREPFRSRSLISDIAEAVISGCGDKSYYMAMEYLAKKI